MLRRRSMPIFNTIILFRQYETYINFGFTKDLVKNCDENTSDIKVDSPTHKSHYKCNVAIYDIYWWSSGRIVPCHGKDPCAIPSQFNDQTTLPK